MNQGVYEGRPVPCKIKATMHWEPNGAPLSTRGLQFSETKEEALFGLAFEALVLDRYVSTSVQSKGTFAPAPYRRAPRCTSRHR